MKILVINTGSSSIKFALYDLPNGGELASGLVEQIGESIGAITMVLPHSKVKEEVVISTHQQGLNMVAQWLMKPVYNLLSSPDEVIAIGHRVVHGGELFKATTIIDAEVKSKIKELFGLAPLHNPPNYQGIEVAESVFPNATQIAVFDTAFHSTLPAKAYRYAIPEYLYEDYGIRVYGFHGTSHRYVTKASAQFLNIPLNDVNLITIHLGNGASMAAIKNGKSVDTSLGMTPLTGLVMGTRVGDIDPGIIFYLTEEKEYDVKKVNSIFNKESGMKGLAGDNDLRNVSELAASGNERAKLALDIYCYRIKKYIGAYYAVLGRLDAIVFTAGVGENSALVREMVCENLGHFGIEINTSENNIRKAGIREINKPESKVKILVTPTNEELEIATQTFNLMQ